MPAQQPELARRRTVEHIRVVLKVEIRRKLLGDHPLGVVDHEGVTDLVTDVGSASVPDFAAEKDAVTGLAEEALLLHTVPVGFPLLRVRPSTGQVAAGDELGGTKFLGHIVEIEVRGGDVDRQA